GAPPDVVQGRVQKADRGPAGLLIGEREEAGPTRRRQAGASDPALASAVRAEIVVGVGFGGDVRNITDRTGSLVRGVGYAALVARQSESVGAPTAAAAYPGGFGLPRAAGAVGVEIGSADRGDERIVGRVPAPDAIAR